MVSTRNQNPISLRHPPSPSLFIHSPATPTSIPVTSFLNVCASPLRAASLRPIRSFALSPSPVTLILRNRFSENLPYFNRIPQRPSSSSSSSRAPQPPANHDAPPSPPAQSPSAASKNPSFLSFTLAGTRLKLPGSLILMTVPLLWSTYAICIKWLYRLPWALTPPVFNFLRLLIAFLFVLPNLFTSMRTMFTNNTPKATNAILRAGTELGLYTFFVNILQAYGLRFTAASRGAFLGQLSTIIVPLAAFATRVEPNLGWNVCAASLLALCGVGLLTFDSVANPFSWRGDGVLLLTAFFNAAFVLRSKIHSPKAKQGPLVALKVSSQTFFAMGFLVATSGVLRSGVPNVGDAFVGATPLLLAINLAIVLWAGLFISVASTTLQLAGQELVPASQAVIIFSSMPLWASFFAIPLGERFGLKGIMGAGLILLSTLLSSWKAAPRKRT